MTYPYSYGAKDHKSVRDVTKLAFTVLWIFSILFLVLVQLIPDTFIRLFIDEADTVTVGGVFIRRWSWCAVGMCLVAMYDAIFQAVGKWKTSLIVAVLRFCMVFPILCFSLDALFGSDGLMWVQPITDTFALLLAAFLFRHFKKSLSKKTATEAAPSAIKHTSNKIIAISREFGSGGRTIGKEVAAKLGIPCYDSELIQKTAEEAVYHKNTSKSTANMQFPTVCMAMLSQAETLTDNPILTEYGLHRKRSLPAWRKRNPA